MVRVRVRVRVGVRVGVGVTVGVRVGVRVRRALPHAHICEPMLSALRFMLPG